MGLDDATAIRIEEVREEKSTRRRQEGAIHALSRGADFYGETR